MLSGELAVLQAPMFDGLSLDPFTLFDDGGSPAEVSVGGVLSKQMHPRFPMWLVSDRE
jgi:hypothetical protein